jgi:hypothetical protein
MKALRTLFAITILLGVASVYSQAANVAILKVSIPFNFTVDNQMLPAGDYTVSASEPTANHVLWLRSADNRHVAIVHTHSAFMNSGANHAQLIFQHSGNEYFLSQVWTLGATDGRELTLPSRVTEMSKETSADNVAGGGF